jgi:hypothetical protein
MEKLDLEDQRNLGGQREENEIFAVATHDDCVFPAGWRSGKGRPTYDNP